MNRKYISKRSKVVLFNVSSNLLENNDIITVFFHLFVKLAVYILNIKMQSVACILVFTIKKIAWSHLVGEHAF